MATVDASPKKTVPLCPSAQPDWQGGITIGVVEGTKEAPRLVHLSRALPVSPELLDLAKPATPTEVFRFAAPCMQGQCVHFRDSRCNLVTQIVNLLPPVEAALPRCTIRSSCRWWLQVGKAACMRCSQMVTDNYNPSAEMRAATVPPGPACDAK